MDINEDKDIHRGHRQRMRDKLISHGPRVFDTYELLEMLLYYAVPYKDTNPIAKRLLMEFGSLDGVFSASEEELCRVSGIGEHAARLIRLVGSLEPVRDELRDGLSLPAFDDYYRAGAYLVRYFSEREGLTVSGMLLDSSMRLLRTVDLYNTNFGSAAVRPRAFIDAAMRAGANVIILAHRQEHGAMFPTVSERATAKLLSDELMAVGVRAVEHYIVSDRDFIGVHSGLSLRLSSDSPELTRFIESKEREDRG